MHPPEKPMPLTLTIKNVPEDLASRLRERAANHRRSLQRELLLILEQTAASAASEPVFGDDRAMEPARAVYKVRPDASGSGRSERRRASGATKSAPTGKLSLEELWRRARELGAASPSESADLIRRDRDARDGR
jgi:plasmid stability protein